MTDQDSNIKPNPYGITRMELVDIAAACQERNFSEQIDLIDQKGGHQQFIKSVNSQKGIKLNQIPLRKQFFGDNSKPVIQPAGYLTLLFNALEDFTLRILLVASVISIIIEVATAQPVQRKTAWIQGVAIFIAVLICANVTAINDYQKERQFQSLNSVADSRKQVSVIRQGKIINMHQDEVLVGDLVNLYEGMEIPADGYVIESSQLSCDQSAMTGQTDPIKKCQYSICKEKRDKKIYHGEKNTSGRHDVPSCIVMSGTRVLTGEGKMIVIVVGDFSCLGKIMGILRQQENQPTPLQMKLQKIASDIGKFGLISAIIILVCLLLRLAIERGIEKSWDHSKHWREIIDYIILSITVVVVAIPQGLPLSVTLSLAFSVKKMLVDNNLVRKMQACETMGGADMICSDKTGTLTTNKMTLNIIWNTQFIQLNPSKQQFDLSTIFKSQYEQLFVLSCCVNSSAELRPEPKGSSTQQAILNFIDKTSKIFQLEYKYQVIRQDNKLIKKYPFSSSRKRMSVIIEYKQNPTIFVKGASQLILKCCDKYYDQQNNVVPLTKQILEKSQRAIQIMAQKALRTIVLAYRPLQDITDYQTKDQLGIHQIQKQKLIFLAIFGIRDVPRKQVPSAVQKCKNAGIRVRMVTGDNRNTAKAIAKQVGIIDLKDRKSLVMDGPQFVKQVGGLVCHKCRIPICDCPTDPISAKNRNCQQRIDKIGNMEKFKQLVQHLDVMARSRPQDKFCLVTGLVEMGCVVAVTGDGTNDAPALKKADVGFAMGIAGTQVARQAAAIILLDDNFNSIVKAVLWGRNIYDSIKKFIQFQLTVNIVAVLITFIGAISMKQQVLTPIQMLWVNLIMDTFASLALATQPPLQQLMSFRPHKRNQYIISSLMFKHIIGQAIYQLIVLLIIIFSGEFFLPQFQSKYIIMSKQINQTLSEYQGRIKNDKSIYTNEVQQWFRKYNQSNNTKNIFYKDFDNQTGIICPGRKRFYNGLTIDFQVIHDALNIYSRHFTYIFNTFVMLQLFNFLNARKIRDQFNIFGGILNNYLFFLVILLILAVQIILVTFANVVFSVFQDGLNIYQWLICVIQCYQIAFGIGGNIWSVLIKLMPIKCCESGNQFQEITVKKNKILGLKRKPSEIHRNLSLIGRNTYHSNQQN